MTEPYAQAERLQKYGVKHLPFWSGFDVEPLLLEEGDALRSRAARRPRQMCERPGHVAHVGMHESNCVRLSEPTRSDRASGYAAGIAVADGRFRPVGGNAIRCLPPRRFLSWARIGRSDPEAAVLIRSQRRAAVRLDLSH